MLRDTQKYIDLLNKPNIHYSKDNLFNPSTTFPLSKSLSKKVITELQDYDEYPLFTEELTFLSKVVNIGFPTLISPNMLKERIKAYYKFRELDYKSAKIKEICDSVYHDLCLHNEFLSNWRLIFSSITKHLYSVPSDLNYLPTEEDIYEMKRFHLFLNSAFIKPFHYIQSEEFLTPFSITVIHNNYSTYRFIPEEHHNEGLYLYDFLEHVFNESLKNIYETDPSSNLELTFIFNRNEKLHVQTFKTYFDPAIPYAIEGTPDCQTLHNSPQLPSIEDENNISMFTYVSTTSPLTGGLEGNWIDHTTSKSQYLYNGLKKSFPKIFGSHKPTKFARISYMFPNIEYTSDWIIE